MEYKNLLAVSICAVATTMLACSQPAAPPTSPAGIPSSATDAAPDGSTLKFTAPHPVSPSGGEVVADDSPELVIDNSRPIFGDGVPVSYVFEVRDLGSNLLYRS